MTEKIIYRCTECFLVFDEWIDAENHEKQLDHKVEKLKEVEPI